ncbi:hypothetical protein QFC21_001251 [Naganishia friedmannii]|uniref:Uncharacterized protein n=1 Tax=Naganishia friedmannii TaxID=89922 RepID=A0ACC2W4I0_9TREE|nr:hypothetical protein QFC21_001251 [Naganishia friedmannii]
MSYDQTPDDEVDGKESLEAAIKAICQTFDAKDSRSKTKANILEKELEDRDREINTLKMELKDKDKKYRQLKEIAASSIRSIHNHLDGSTSQSASKLPEVATFGPTPENVIEAITARNTAASILVSTRPPRTVKWVKHLERASTAPTILSRYGPHCIWEEQNEEYGKALEDPVVSVWASPVGASFAIGPSTPTGSGTACGVPQIQVRAPSIPAHRTGQPIESRKRKRHSQDEEGNTSPGW